MKKRISHVAVSQCGKMMAAIYFVISLPFVAILLIPTLMGIQVMPLAALVLFPFMYALITYLMGALIAWIYNLVAARMAASNSRPLKSLAEIK